MVEKFGVGPERVIDVQALAGDSVDNVPGAPGIGIKTAAQLIQEYGDLDTLLARAGEIKQPKRREVLLGHADQIRISRDLVTLRRDVPVEDPLEALEVREPEAGVLLPWLGEMEFRGLAGRVAAKLGVDAPVIAPKAEAEQGPASRRRASRWRSRRSIRRGSSCCDDAAALAGWVARIRERGALALAVETDASRRDARRPIGIGLATGAGEAAYLPLGHVTGSGGLFGEPAARARCRSRRRWRLLGPGARGPGGDEGRAQRQGALQALRAAGHSRWRRSTTPCSCPSRCIPACTGTASRRSSDAYLNHTPGTVKSLTGSGKAALTFAQVGVEEAGRCVGEHAEVVWRLWWTLKPRLPFARVTRVYETMERPLVPVLAEMERHGVRVDRQALSRLSGDFAQRMAALEEEAYRLAGGRFNIGSPKQLGEVLFDQMGLGGGRKGKTGAYSTGADVLEELAAQGHDLPARVLDWRLLSKLKSTYTDTLQDAINPETGRVHTSYMIAGAATGRLASQDPNLQNIPVRTEEGRRIREAFVAEAGNVLLSLDYSQIELRLLAHIADIPALKAAFQEGLDIHAMTASEMFGVPIEGMPAHVRRQAKAINFGVIYGISAFGLANNLRIPREDAKRFIDTYFERFPGIREYMNRTIAFGKEHGHVETLFGRRIHTPEINARGPHAAPAQRQAINAPIQGSAADVIRRAMVRVPEAIRDLPARMLLQVHDELLFEVAEDAVDETVARVRAVMAGAPRCRRWHSTCRWWWTRARARAGPRHTRQGGPAVGRHSDATRGSGVPARPNR